MFHENIPLNAANYAHRQTKDVQPGSHYDISSHLKKIPFPIKIWQNKPAASSCDSDPLGVTNRAKA